VIAAGEAAPEFSLGQDDGESYTKASLEARHTIFVFYPFAFSPVCTEQLTLYEEVLDEIGDQGGRLYGVSCDSIHAQRAFRESLGVRIEQLSDWEPKGLVCEAFGVRHPGGFPQRAIVVLEPGGTVEWSYQAESPGDLPGANLIFDALSAAPAK